MQLVPDTSVIVDGRVSEGVADGRFDDASVLVPEAVVGELEAQANDGREPGWEGLEELQRLVDLDSDGAIEVEYVGRRPEALEKREAGEGEIDALIRDLAAERNATLLTSDDVQAEVARAKGLEVTYLEPRSREVETLALEEYFDETAMSVHLKVGVRPQAKRGSIGEMHYEPIREEPLTEGDLLELAADVMEGARSSPDGFVELDEPGMTIVQFRTYRIAVARPPFSDALEITAVRPIVKTELDDYEHADDLRERLLERQRGVLIAGSPGAGKSTFAQAVGEFLVDSDFAVKTMEKPRDLQVGPDITQYTALGGEMAKTADSLLMVRPDYTIYDEVRKTDDFEVFADMRLAGVGMIGVVHATRAIDALQRLIGRVELGLIPQVVDTVVYIEAGKVDTVYDVQTDVKVPEGLVEEDLARPVILVSDFETGHPAFEIYTFNRQVVTVPIGEEAGDGEAGRGPTGAQGLASQEVEREIRAIAQGDVAVEFRGGDRAVVWVEERDISQVIGKGGGRISDVEERLGIDIDVRTFAERPDGKPGRASGAGGSGGGAGGGGGGGGAPTGGPTGSAAGDGGAGGAGGGSAAGGRGEIVPPEVTSRHVVIPMEGYAGDTVEVQADGEYLFTATVSRGGEIQVSRGSSIAEELERAIDRGRQITAIPS